MRRKYDKDLIDLAVVILIVISGVSGATDVEKLIRRSLGSHDRKLILNAVRKELQITNQFNVLYLKVKKDAAYFAGNVIKPADPMKYDVDPVRALIEKQGNGAWKVVEIWTLAKEDASAEQRNLFNQRVRKDSRKTVKLETSLMKTYEY